MEMFLEHIIQYIRPYNAEECTKTNFGDVTKCDTCKSENKKETPTTWGKHKMTLENFEQPWNWNMLEWR